MALSPAERARLDALVPSLERLTALSRRIGCNGFYVFTISPEAEILVHGRMFAPAIGIAEDPVTGAMHCTLIPYWANELGKNKLLARQVSKRGGELSCEFFGIHRV